MNWKNILIISSLVNIILIIELIYKYNLSNHSSTVKIDGILGMSNRMVSRQNDYFVRSIESKLYKKPKLKRPVIEGIVKLRGNENDTKEYLDSLIAKIETIKNDSGDIDLENRVEPYALLKEKNDLKNILSRTESTLDSMESAFDEMMQAIRIELKNELPKDYEKEIKSRVPIIDFKSKIKSLKNISLLETRMVLRSLQVDLSNVSSIYLSAIDELMPLRYRDEFDRLKVVILPKTTQVKLGEKYEAQLAVVKYLSSYNGSISVNGKEYPLGEDGIVHFKEKPNKTGKQVLKLKSRIVNPLSGEVMSGSSTFEYHVLP